MHYQATKITRFFGLFGGANKEVKMRSLAQTDPGT